jgi:hypothetical protein
LKNYAGIYRLSDGTYRIVAKAIDPKNQNAAVAYRTELINEIKTGTTAGGVPTESPRLETLCRSSCSWEYAWPVRVDADLNARGHRRRWRWNHGRSNWSAVTGAT